MKYILIFIILVIFIFYKSLNLKEYFKTTTIVRNKYVNNLYMRKNNLYGYVIQNVKEQI